MNRRKRLRKAGHLCLHCLRNLAFFRAWEKDKSTRRTHQYWITAGNNFLDIAVLDWCKLFADRNAKHHWRKLVEEHATFQNGMMVKLQLTEEKFEQYIKEMRTYRDKFIAHLDDENTMNIPNLLPAHRSAVYLYHWLLKNENDCDAFFDAPSNATTFFKTLLTQGKAIHSDHTTTNPSIYGTASKLAYLQSAPHIRKS
jgi:hypothetical protein